MDEQTLPSHLEFKRSARVSHFVRGILVMLVGAAVFVAALDLNRVHLSASATVENALRCIGGGVALSGVIAVLLLVVASVRDTTQVVEVDDAGLALRKGGDKPTNRSLKWADVASYEITSGGSLFGPGSFIDTSNTNRGDSDPLGCLFGLMLGVYAMLLEFFVTGGGTWTVKFNMQGKKRGLSISGHGPAMDDLLYRVLPHYLPDKLVRSGEKRQAE